MLVPNPRKTSLVLLAAGLLATKEIVAFTQIGKFLISRGLLGLNVDVICRGYDACADTV